MTTDQQFEQLKGKVLRLIQKLELTTEELRLSREENLALEKIIEDQNDQLKSFQNKDKISKIVASVAVDGNANSLEKATDLKLKINEYIKEIDKCIMHLTK